MDDRDWCIVRSTPLFGRMPQDVAQGIVGNHGAQIYRPGALLFQQGEPATCFYVVLDGWVKIYRTKPDGNEAVIGVFHRGETFAEASIFMGGVYPANAEVVSTSRLLRVDGTVLLSRIRETPDLALSMLASASYHLKSLVEQIEQIKLLTAPQRVAEFILTFCTCEEGPCTIELPYSKSLIANRLGMKPESLSRALAKLRPLGVHVDRGQVNIDDVHALSAYIQTDQMGEDAV